MELTVDRGTEQLAVTIFPSESADTTIVIFPAMGTPAGYYRRFATSLQGAGLAVAVADLRGTGASRPRPSRASRYGYAELADDVGAVLEALAPQRASRRTILLGHSLGGQAAAVHLARCAETGASPDVDGLVLIAVGLPYWRIYGRQRGGVWAFTQGIQAVSTLLGVWPGWGFGGRQARGVIRDWGYTARHGSYPETVTTEDALAKIAVPVLAISVDHDQYTPPNTLDHLVAKLASAPVRREHLTVAAAGIPLDHFKWVRAGKPLTERIIAWLRTSKITPFR